MCQSENYSLELGPRYSKLSELAFWIQLLSVISYPPFYVSYVIPVSYNLASIFRLPLHCVVGFSFIENLLLIMHFRRVYSKHWLFPNERIASAHMLYFPGSGLGMRVLFTQSCTFLILGRVLGSDYLPLRLHLLHSPCLSPFQVLQTTILKVWTFELLWQVIKRGTTHLVQAEDKFPYSVEHKQGYTYISHLNTSGLKIPGIHTLYSCSSQHHLCYLYHVYVFFLLKWRYIKMLLKYNQHTHTHTLKIPSRMHVLMPSKS